MAIEFDCSGCGRTYRVDESLAGKRTKCKICDAILTVPAPKAARPASRPPLQTFGGTAAAPAPTLRPKLSPEPEYSSAHLYGIEDDDDGPVLARSSYDDEPEEEIQGPRRPARPGQAKGKKASRGEYAGFWRRFAAYLIDGVILWVALIVCAFLYGMGVGFYYARVQGRMATPDEIATAVLYFYFGWLAVVLGYYGGMISSSHQATLGKMALGIKVCDLDGRPIGFGRAIARELAKILSSIFLIGFIMAAFTEKKQALHDILLQTLVVKG